VCLFAILASIGQSRPSPKPNSGSGCGPPANEQLKCASFGFNYKIPFGWVDRTEDMQGLEKPGQGTPDQDAKGSAAHEGDATQANNGLIGQQPGGGQAEASPSAGKSKTLLAVFERPPEAVGDTINSAVVIAAESREIYPKVKTAADYFGAISDLAEQRGLKATSDPYASAIGAKQLVREDFSGEPGKLPVFQSTLAMIEHGEIVSFTFIGGSDDEIDGLIEGLTFTTARR
jgi:hypothetical protein